MSETVSQLLASFDSLPPQEQHELITAMLRRSCDSRTLSCRMTRSSIWPTVGSRR